MIKIYTDGSCRGNGKKKSVGANAFVILDEEEKVIAEWAGAERNTTNNRMEMKAIINAISELEEYSYSAQVKIDKISIYTDSAYIHNCMKQKWYINWQKNNWLNSKKEPVKNKDLWEVLIPYFTNEKITFNKVKGHADNKWNNYVDELAQSASAKLK